MLYNSRNAKRIVSTPISNPLGRDDRLNRCDDGGLSALTAVHTEGSFPPYISPFLASSPGGVSLWGRKRSAVRYAIHSREPILVGHHPLNTICSVFRLSGVRITVFWKSTSTTFRSITFILTPHLKTHPKLNQISLFFFSGNHRTEHYLILLRAKILLNFCILKCGDPFGDNVRDGPMGKLPHIGPFSYNITPTALHSAVICLELELGPKGRISCCNSLLR
jgi:hypothetical protein